MSPLLPPTTPGGFVFKTEAELEEQILKEIDLNRKKIREKRAEKRRKQELEGIENLSPERYIRYCSFSLLLQASYDGKGE